MSDTENAGALTVESRTRWLELQEELLRGVTHALSNRIATVSAAAYMLEYEDMTCQQGAEQLRVETERMDTLLQLLRLLPSRNDEGTEPVAPSDIIEQAVSLHAQHGALRDVAVRVTAPADIMPVLVEPHAFLQALLLAITPAKRVALQRSGDVALTVASSADEVSILILPTALDAAPATGAGAADAIFSDAAASNETDAACALKDAAAANWCLRSSHGQATVHSDGGCIITLPTLSAARRAGR